MYRDRLPPAGGSWRRQKMFNAVLSERMTRGTLSCLEIHRVYSTMYCHPIKSFITRRNRLMKLFYSVNVNPPGEKVANCSHNIL